MNHRFQLDDDADGERSSAPAPTDVYDASEEIFSASLEAVGKPRFRVEDSDDSVRNSPVCGEPEVPLPSAQTLSLPGEPVSYVAPEVPTESWKQQVAARMDSYRSRRRVREPRYPSLMLKFEAPETGLAASPASSSFSDISAPAITSEPTVAFTPEPIRPPMAALLETTARVLEFPRSGLYLAPPPSADELAEPVAGLPRILEVPDLAPPPPALGGILINPVEVADHSRRLGIEVPLQTSSLGRRVGASIADVMLVASAVGEFGYIFYSITNWTPTLPQAFPLVAGVASLVWAIYQYAFLFYSGATPGSWMMGLRLSRFDGSRVTSQTRRWRALASLLSAAAVGLGYAWALLDEDRLCWHDRITHTYLAPNRSVTPPPQTT